VNKKRNGIFEEISKNAVSAFLIVAYIASRTLGVPIVGVEYYVGRLDILTKILQGIVIGLSCVAIISMKKQEYSRRK